jgi:methylmalonyl-CoA mutase N-terminal domain/subunit
VNMLRMTTALLGGAIGGADAMAGFGHDVLTGESAGARRIARLAQVMMMAESHLQASLDPAAGAPFIESRTIALADAGWRFFQQIEQAGGLAAARRSGLIDEWADSAAAARESSLRKGDTGILGVTLQPRSEMVSAVLPAFADVRRPAALVEDIRRAASQNAPRVLILRGAEATGEDAIRRHLAIAGLDALTLQQGDAGIDAARPDWVIGCGVDAPPAGLPPARFIKGDDLLQADDRLALLAMLAGARGAE